MFTITHTQTLDQEVLHVGEIRGPRHQLPHDPLPLGQYVSSLQSAYILKVMTYGGNILTKRAYIYSVV